MEKPTKEMLNFKLTDNGHMVFYLGPNTVYCESHNANNKQENNKSKLSS